ncbi:multicopper oxidase domain-containing protein [Archangium sp.]|uniref:multicopper oxidase domain-containing protein n=1 Tax=Archangium sp. TaxID=1872627 RepID=UPI002D252CE8|nr:multicopper oxidase domain-containing protein [Archangium sp.]HYO60017.1 multicopper oxidase domain-containing protein [Archangium sp.]
MATRRAPRFPAPSSGRSRADVSPCGSATTFLPTTRRPGTTASLHVHGLEVVPHLFEPVGTSEPTTQMIAIHPGEEKLYAFTLPDDHPTGLYWYHPHHHGSTAVQVQNGMAGAISC